MRRSAASRSWARVLESGAPIRRDEGTVATPTPCHVEADDAKQVLSIAVQSHSTAVRGGRGERLEDNRLLHRPVVGGGPLPLLRGASLGLPGASPAPPRRCGGDRLRR